MRRVRSAYWPARCARARTFEPIPCPSGSPGLPGTGCGRGSRRQPRRQLWPPAGVRCTDARNAFEFHGNLVDTKGGASLVIDTNDGVNDG
jgi:hypothetical protein